MAAISSYSAFQNTRKLITQMEGYRNSLLKALPLPAVFAVLRLGPKEEGFNKENIMPFDGNGTYMLDHPAEGRAECWGWVLRQLTAEQKMRYHLVMAAIQAWTAAPDGGGKWNGYGITSATESFRVQQMFLDECSAFGRMLYKARKFELANKGEATRLACQIMTWRMREDCQLAYQGESTADDPNELAKMRANVMAGQWPAEEE